MAKSWKPIRGPAVLLAAFIDGRHDQRGITVALDKLRNEVMKAIEEPMQPNDQRWPRCGLIIFSTHEIGGTPHCSALYNWGCYKSGEREGDANQTGQTRESRQWDTRDVDRSKDVEVHILGFA
jgi:hypothetical protein